MNDNNILAVILAGGKSKRFGEDKNLAKLGSISLIEHTIYKIREKFKKILIIANNDLKVEEFKDIEIIPDHIKGNLGPLVGVLTAMKWAKRSKENYKWIATFPSDRIANSSSLLAFTCKTSSLSVIISVTGLEKAA